MNRKPIQIAMWIEWLALPLMALRYWSVWDLLPPVLATHFDAAGQVNGWMSREDSLWFTLGLFAFVLTVFSIIVFLAQKSGPQAIAWALLTFSYCVVGFIALGCNAVLQYNLTGQPIHLSAYVFAIAIPVVLLIVAVLVSQRGSELPPGKAIAEEVHASSVWGIGFLAVGFATLIVILRLRLGPALGPLGLVSIVFLAVGGAAWSGFHYYFTPHGVEVRALGFRLKSIPAQQIQRYAVDQWSAIRGYGIRGAGNCRAYVWGNKGMWITTASERVFLGHSEPERLVRDMDRMMKFAKA